MDLVMVLDVMSLTKELVGHRGQPLGLLERSGMGRCLHDHEHDVHSVEVCLELEGLCSLGSHRLATLGYSHGVEWSVRWLAVPRGSLASLPGPGFLSL